MISDLDVCRNIRTLDNIIQYFYSKRLPENQVCLCERSESSPIRNESPVYHCNEVFFTCGFLPTIDCTLVRNFCERNV